MQYCLHPVMHTAENVEALLLSSKTPYTHTRLTLTSTIQCLCYLLPCLSYLALQQHAPTPDDSPCPFTALPLCYLLQLILLLPSNKITSDLQLVTCPVQLVLTASATCCRACVAPQQYITPPHKLSCLACTYCFCCLLQCLCGSSGIHQHRPTPHKLIIIHGYAYWDLVGT